MSQSYSEMSDERKLQRALRRKERREKAAAKRRRAAALSGTTLKKAKGGAKNRCRAKTRTTGEPCPMYRAVLEDPVDGKLYKAATCYAHLPEKFRERFNAKPVGGKTSGSGTASFRRAKPNEILRQMV